MVGTKASKSASARATIAKKKNKTLEARNAVAKQEEILNDRLDVLSQILEFKGFLGSSFEPSISDSEIIVCFADIRGFTTYCRNLQKEMQDRKIQNFLRTYIKIFNQGLMRWFIENLDEKFSAVDADMKVISKYVYLPCTRI